MCVSICRAQKIHEYLSKLKEDYMNEVELQLIKPMVQTEQKLKRLKAKWQLLNNLLDRYEPSIPHQYKL